MEQYKLVLTLAKSNDGFDLTADPKYLDILKKCAKTYNDKSKGKEIEIIESSLKPRSFIIILSSPKELEIPGRSIRHFSQALVEHKEFEDMVINKKLFLTEPAAADNLDGGVVDPNTIDDIEFLKSLIDYLYNKAPGSSTEYKKKRKALNKMKIIAKEEGLLK